MLRPCPSVLPSTHSATEPSTHYQHEKGHRGRDLQNQIIHTNVYYFVASRVQNLLNTAYICPVTRIWSLLLSWEESSKVRKLKWFSLTASFCLGNCPSDGDSNSTIIANVKPCLNFWKHFLPLLYGRTLFWSATYVPIVQVPLTVNCGLQFTRANGVTRTGTRTLTFKSRRHARLAFRRPWFRSARLWDTWSFKIKNWTSRP